MTISCDGLDLRVWDHGEEEDDLPRALFVHGYLDTGRSFDRVAAALKGRVRALCLDWRGHGQSQWAPGGASYHLLDHIKDLTRVLRHFKALGSGCDLLVAHSMGANIALMTAGACPKLVSRLLLLDGFGPPAEDPALQPQRLGRVLQSMDRARPFRSFESREEAAQRMVDSNYGLSGEGARFMARHLVEEDPLSPGQWVFKLDPRLRGPTPVRYPEQTWLTFFERARGPVRLLRAEGGYVAETETFRRRVEACGAAVVNVSGASHHLHVDRPDAVAAQVLDMLSDHSPDLVA